MCYIVFIAEGGPDCLKSKQEEIQQCLNSTFSKYIPKELADKKDDLPLLTLGRAECGSVLVNVLLLCFFTSNYLEYFLITGDDCLGQQQKRSFKGTS